MLCERCNRPRIPDEARTKSWNAACDAIPSTTIGAWRDELAAEWPGHCDATSTLTCHGDPVDWRTRALRAERELAGNDPRTEYNGFKPDWPAVKDASDVIRKYTEDSWFSPPEGTHRYAVRVSEAVVRICTALALRPAAVDGMVKYRQLAQDLLTSYQRFASNADGAVDSEIEKRAEEAGLDIEAWLK